MTEAMEGFARERFTGPVAGKPKSFDVYTLGAGPPVIVMQELPGIGPQFLAFCRKLAGAGFEVWIPHWFGPLGRTTPTNLLRVFCMRREFQLFAKNKSSAIVDWMRALTAHVAKTRNAPKVGVIGMCLSGNFCMTLIADEHVWAAVASQPSLPARTEGHVHMSGEEIAASRAAIETKGPMRSYRFEGDPLCDGARFAAIDQAFNDDQVRVVLNVLPGAGHSVFAMHYDDAPASPTRAAFEDVLSYLRERLS